jgi:hypothetical protein
VLVLGTGERLVDLHVGVAAGGDLAEDLHEAVLAEADRGVALLAGEERGVGVQVEVVALEPVELHVVGGQAPGERGQPLGGGEPVVHRVVGVDVPELLVVPDPDQRVSQPLL